MILRLTQDLLVFICLSGGLAWPVVSRLPLTHAERLAASAAISLFASYAVAFAAYALSVPSVFLWVLPIGGVIGLFLGRGALVEAWRDSSARQLMIGQALVSTWCLGWLALVVSYSGGAWAGDWAEHWERTQFFLNRMPRNTLLLGFYELTARPPLANVLTSAFLQLTQSDFLRFQLFTSLLNSIAFLPAALLAQRFAPGKAVVPVIALLLMLNPLFVQNSTFAWTKLSAAFFVLTSLYFFLRASDGSSKSRPLQLILPVLAFGILAAGILAHYSVGPYAVALAAAWFGLNRSAWKTTDFWMRTSLIAVSATVVLATWFGWAVQTYGARSTFLSNTAASSSALKEGGQLLKIATNIVDTIVPPSFHGMAEIEQKLLKQDDLIGWVRDWAFLHYQLNVVLACGCVGGLAVLWLLYRDPAFAGPTAGKQGRSYRGFWIWFVGIVILLGVGTHASPSAWGLAHICLQALILTGIAFLASRWEQLGRGFRTALVIGAAVDFILGIALHFGVQNFSSERIAGLSYAAGANFKGKVQLKLRFLADAANPTLVCAVLAVLLIGGILWCRANARPEPKS